MTAPAITIAMSDGVPADELGRRAAERLGFSYLNNEIVREAAQVAGVTPEDVAKVEHSQSLAERILLALARYPNPDELMNAGAGLPQVIDETPKYREVIRQVLWETGKLGKVVIGAHGASIHLAAMANVLRVFVTRSREPRAKRWAADHSVPESEALKRIDHGDRERAAYLKRFYGISK